MFQSETTSRLYATPFSGSYWRESLRSMRSVRMLVFAALMIAMARALSLIPSIPMGTTKLSFGFLARALCGMVCGPVVSVAFGFAEDILGFILQPSGEFFFGYTISTMVGALVYALCFYRHRVTVLRLTLANVLVNVFVNAFMGSVWNLMIRGGTYWGWFVPSITKNMITIIPKVILMYVVYQALLPILQRMRVIPRQLDERGRITWF